MTEKLAVTVRRANPDYANLLAELGARTFLETFAGDITGEDMDAYIASNFNVAQQTAELAHPASTFLIAEADGVAAGYAKLHAGEPARASKAKSRLSWFDCTRRGNFSAAASGRR